MGIILKRPLTRQPQSSVGLDFNNPLLKSVVGFWDFSQPKVRDLVGSNNPSTITSGLSLVRTKTGLMTKFNGSSDYVQVNNYAALNDYTKGKTYNILLTCPIGYNAPSYTRILEKGANSELTIGLGAGSGTAVFVADLGAGTPNIGSPEIFINDGSLVLVTVTISPSGYLNVYLNGKFYFGKQCTPLTVSTGTLNIGQYGGSGFNYGGLMAYVMASNREFSSFEVAKFGLNPWQIFSPSKLMVTTGSIAGGGGGGGTGGSRIVMFTIT